MVLSVGQRVRSVPSGEEQAKRWGCLKALGNPIVAPAAALLLLAPPCYLADRRFCGVVLHRPLNNLLRIELNDTALDELAWRDFGNGLAMSRLAREGQAELVLYRIRADASHDAFLKHEHIGGEFYLVLKGKITDETGEYGKGDVVFLDRQSIHTPRAIGETIVLVFWPEGVRIVD